MTKIDICEKIKENLGVPTRKASEMLETVLKILKNALANGEDVRISGFGKFLVKQKADRTGRNPQTGDAITIEARRVLTFRPSHILKGQINQKTT